jgi:predicted nucleotidyltransferase
MNLKELKESPEVLSIVLFGSTARRDDDQYSDKDIFVMCRDLDIENLLKIKEDFIIPAIGYIDGISCYRHKDVLLMAHKGSLFLWHLKLQGKILFSKQNSFENILATLQPYKNYEEDLSIYRELLSDVIDNFQKRKTISEFDISILFTIVRNVCILLCYHEVVPKFGRSNAYITARRLFAEGLPLEETVFPKLCSYKLWYERGVKPGRDLFQDFPISSTLEQIGHLIEFAREKCK